MRPLHTTIESELAGFGPGAPTAAAAARIRSLLDRELRHGRAELAAGRARSGYDAPVLAAFARTDARGLLALLPVDPLVRTDLQRAGEHAFLVAAAAIGALAEEVPRGDALAAGAAGGMLTLTLSGDVPLDADAADAAALVFDDLIGPVDRVRARALGVPVDAMPRREDDARPLAADHPFGVALLYARAGINPADRVAVAEHEELIASRIDRHEPQGASRPHDDPDPARRAARRILQRLSGMGKWGGYHTEFTHLSRGFPPHDRAAVERVAEALIDAGLLAEKRSVGQRHVYLDPRQTAAIVRLIETGEVPPGLRLPDL